LIKPSIIHEPTASPGCWRAITTATTLGYLIASNTKYGILVPMTVLVKVNFLHFKVFIVFDK